MARSLKVAVQMYGHLRTYEKCAPFLKKNLLDLYDCDVFLHTWDKTEHTTRVWYDEKVKSERLDVGSETLDQVKRFYDPKKIKIETQNLFSEAGYFGTHPQIQISLNGFKYMLYAQHAVNELRKAYETETGTKYDYVVVIRPDILPFVPLDIEKYRAEFDFYPRVSIHLIHNSIMVKKGEKFFNFPLIFDCFYFSTPNIVNQITDCFLQFDRYFKDINQILPMGVENPESSICEYMLENAIIPRQYRFYFAIKRKNSDDDIQCLPPHLSELEIGSPTPKKIVKLMIRRTVYVFLKSPSIVQRPIKSFLSQLARLNAFIVRLESEEE